MDLNGQNWQAVGDELPTSVRTLYSDGEELYAGVTVITTGGNSLAKLYGSEWEYMPNWCITTQTSSILEFDDELIVAGSCGVKSLSGGSWEYLGSSSRVVVNGLDIVDDKLVVTGSFDSIGGIAADNIALWDGVVWQAVDTTVWAGTNSNFSCALEYQGDLHVGGSISDFWSGIDAVAVWDGTNWDALQGPFYGSQSVGSMEIFQGDLYVGGAFLENELNAMIGNHLSRWDGYQWKELGGGIGNGTGSVRDLLVFEDELYVVGAFSEAGGIPAQYIAKWNGVEWCSFGDVFDNVINKIIVHEGELYIGGAFTTINGQPISRVAKWVGGDYVHECGSLNSIDGVKTEDNELTMYPNPTNSTVTINLPTHNQQKEVRINLYDVHGRLLEVPTVARAENVELDLSNLPTGMYFGQVVIGEQRTSFKVVRE